MSLIDDGRYWRARATESRIAADCMVDACCRQIMLGIAADYDRIAGRIEKQDAWTLGVTPTPATSGFHPAPSVQPCADPAWRGAAAP
jgi:hypothetical protein